MPPASLDAVLRAGLRLQAEAPERFEAEATGVCLKKFPVQEKVDFKPTIELNMDMVGASTTFRYRTTDGFGGYWLSSGAKQLKGRGLPLLELTWIGVSFQATSNAWTASVTFHGTRKAYDIKYKPGDKTPPNKRFVNADATIPRGTVAVTIEFKTSKNCASELNKEDNFNYPDGRPFSEQFLPSTHRAYTNVPFGALEQSLRVIAGQVLKAGLIQKKK